MEFIIKDQNTAQSRMEASKLAWKVFNQKNRKRYIISLVFAALLIIVAIYENQQMNYFLASIYAGLSTGMLYSLFILYRSMSKQRSQLFKDLDRQILLFRKGSNESIAKIDDIGIEITTELFCQQINWAIVKDVQVVEQFLFIKIYDSLFSAIAIDKKDIENTEFNRLLIFIRSKIPMASGLF